jgi:hypothetical protein
MQSTRLVRSKEVKVKKVKKAVLKISVHFNSQMIAITVVAAVFVIVMAVTCFIFFLRKSGRVKF